MSTCYKAIAAMIITLILLAACGKTEPTATLFTPTLPQAQDEAATPVTPTAHLSWRTVPGTLVPPTLGQAQDKAHTPISPTATPALPTLWQAQDKADTPTPTLTPTPTPTFTPTPAALPASVSGDVRTILSHGPLPRGNAPCGIIDMLDFPLNPPHGRNAVMNPGFGGFSENYNGHHAGEDWGKEVNSAGMLVYSIGHGQVTYAQPFGWGRDGGVVIVRHIFPEGNAVLSFYGHLDPSSVTLRAGDCIARGDSVGKIGSPQHLHFEIRTHMPNTPGPGYWSVDPTLAGWKPPSETIWNYRIAISPGRLWSWPFIAQFTRVLGKTDDTLITIQDRQLMEINVDDGSVRWSRLLFHRPRGALLDLNHDLIYLTASLGRIQAFSLSDLQNDDPGSVSTPLAEAVWTIESKAYGDVALLPLPGGGVIVATKQRMLGVSARGELLWDLDTMAPLYDWASTEDAIVFTTSDEHNPLWSVDESGPLAWDVSVSGRPVISGGTIYVYGEEGVYRLNPTTRSAELVYALPQGDLNKGDITPLPAGGLLVAHADKYDQRLIALNPNGSLRWERSSAAFSLERARLLTFDSQMYVALQRNTNASNLVLCFLIDTDSAELTHLFTGGSRRNSSSADTWAMAIDDEYTLINIGGGNLVALDPRVALDAILQATSSH